MFCMRRAANTALVPVEMISASTSDLVTRGSVKGTTKYTFGKASSRFPLCRNGVLQHLCCRSRIATMRIHKPYSMKYRRSLTQNISTRRCCRAESQDENSEDASPPSTSSSEETAVLPSLFFQPHEVMLPGSRKVLHLYEARFLALLDECMKSSGGLLVHATNINGMVNLVATLARIESIERAEVGARVELVAEQRVRVLSVKNMEPYIRMEVAEVMTCDSPGTLCPTDDEMSGLSDLLSEVRQLVKEVLMLGEKIQLESESMKGGELSEEEEEEEEEDDQWEEWGHTELSSLRESMEWVDQQIVSLSVMKLPITMEEGFAACQASEVEMTRLQEAERLSFALLQMAPESTHADLTQLLHARESAMSLQYGLLERLQTGRDILEDQRNTLRAKTALLALNHLSM